MQDSEVFFVEVLENVCPNLRSFTRADGSQYANQSSRRFHFKSFDSHSFFFRFSLDVTLESRAKVGDSQDLFSQRWNPFKKNSSSQILCDYLRTSSRKTSFCFVYLTFVSQWNNSNLIFETRCSLWSTTKNLLLATCSTRSRGTLVEKTRRCALA